MISQNSNNSRKLFKALNTTLNRKTELPLPPYNDRELAENFSSFSNKKSTKYELNLTLMAIQHPMNQIPLLGHPFSISEK